MSHLNPDQVTGNLNAVADYAKTIPASNGKLFVGGFCWGGEQTFRFATNRCAVGAAFVSTAQMKAAGKTFEPVVYDGAGHGFMRAGEAHANDANKKGRQDTWFAGRIS